MVSKAKKSKKVDKKNKNVSLTKKYFDAKKVHQADYRGSNYTMSSDDEVFNVSGHAVNKHQFPPIKKSMHQAKDVGSVYSNQIMKPKKKQPSPKMTMNMAGLVHNQNSGLKGIVNFGPGDIRNKQMSM